MKKITKYLKSILQIIALSFSMIFFSTLFAATPNPGHPWSQIGDGIWAATGTTAYRTFTFPDADATVLTTNTPVTIGQGGTANISTSTAMTALSQLLAKGDLFVYTGSVIGRLVVGTNNQVLMSSSSQTTGLAWAPLAIAPAGSNTHIQINDGNVFGATSAFTFDNSSQTLGINGKINFTTQSDPAASATGTMNLYVKGVSGRSLLKAIGQYGVDYSYQPSLFQNAIYMISTGAGTTYSVFGTTASSTGTISHVVSESLGYMANQVTAAGAGSTAGTGTYGSNFFRGSQVGSNGFFFQARMAFPTATTTGTRVFVGFTTGLISTSVSSDSPTESQIGWQYSTVRGDTGWKFVTSDGVSQTVSSTILPFGRTTDVMDFFIYCPPYPNNTIIYYRIDNVTQGTTAEGTASATLPAGNVGMAAGFQLNNIAAGAKNVRLSRMYVETDR